MDQDNKENKEIDLSGAMRDSDSGVKFQNDKQRPTQTFFPGAPKIIQWVIKYSGGLVKNEKQASYVIFGFVALAIIVSLFLVFRGGEEKLTPEEKLFLDTPPSQFNP